MIKIIWFFWHLLWGQTSPECVYSLIMLCTFNKHAQLLLSLWSVTVLIPRQKKLLISIDGVFVSFLSLRLHDCPAQRRSADGAGGHVTFIFCFKDPLLISLWRGLTLNTFDRLISGWCLWWTRLSVYFWCILFELVRPRPFQWSCCCNRLSKESENVMTENYDLLIWSDGGRAARAGKICFNQKSNWVWDTHTDTHTFQTRSQ